MSKEKKNPAQKPQAEEPTKPSFILLAEGVANMLNNQVGKSEKKAFIIMALDIPEDGDMTKALFTFGAQGMPENVISTMHAFIGTQFGREITLQAQMRNLAQATQAPVPTPNMTVKKGGKKNG